MEELEPRTGVCPSRTYIGFTIFDVLHIVCAIVLLVFAVQKSPINEMEAAECNVEIIMSLLLIAFIASLAKFQANKELFHASYTFAWLCALASIMIPLSFSIPEIIYATWEGHKEIAATLVLIFALVLSFVAFAIFLVSLFFKKKPRYWNDVVHVALILVLVLSTLCVVEDFLLEERTPVERVFCCIKDLAPVVPAVLGLSLWKNRDFHG